MKPTASGRSWRKRSTVVALCAALAIPATACSSQSPQGGSGANGHTGKSGEASLYNASIAKMLPNGFPKGKTVTIPTDATYPPDQLKSSSGAIIGLDPDLGHAIGQVLGLKFDFVDAPFDSIIPGVVSGKWLISMTADENTPEREKVVDFVTAWKTGLSFMVPASSSVSIKKGTDVCGLKVGINKGNIAYELLQQASKKCVAGGHPAIALTQFPGQDAVNLAMQSGRVQATCADEMTLAYTAQKTHGQMKLEPYTFATATEGIVVKKNSHLLRPLQAALKYLIKQGTYRDIFARWNVSRAMIDNPQIFPASSRS